MIELCGATRAAGHDRRRRRGSGAARDRLREARVQAILGIEIPRARQARDPERAGLRHRRGRRRPGRDPAAGPARGRHARGRPDRGGRADRRARAAARDAARAPGRRTGRLSHEQRLRRARSTRSSGVACTRRSGGRSPRRASPSGCAWPPRILARQRRRSRTRCRRSSRCCARRCSARCSTRPRTTSRAACADLRLFEVGHRVPPPRAGEAPSGAAGRRAPRARRAARGAHGAAPSWGVRRARRGRLLRRQGAARSALPRRCACDGVELAPGAAAVPAPRPRRRVPRRRGPIGWLGELHPLVAGAGSCGARSCFEVDLDRLIAAAPRDSGLRGPDRLPAAAPGPRGRSCPCDVPAARGAGAPRARLPVSCCATCACSTSTAAPQVGEGRRSLALALSFRASTGRSPTRTSRPCASGSSRRWARWGVSCDG